MTRLLIACLVVAAGITGAGSDAQIQPPAQIPWEPDTLLQGFWKYTIPLGSDYDGPITATLIRRPKTRTSGRECAVLYIHGFVDYFFQRHMADFYETVTAPRAPTGCDFFALDLRKYGRSLPDGYKYKNFAKSLDEYFDEITFALKVIESDGYSFTLLNGHSTGALTAVRYVQSGRLGGRVSALFLNSPFLDFSDRDLKEGARFAAKIVGRLRPHGKQGKPSVPIWYARSLLLPSECADCHGRWKFEQKLKPIEGFPVFFGWVRAIINAQDRALKQTIATPILILHSARSNDGTDTIWHEEYRRADLVLDVEDMKNLGPALGPNVVIRPIEGGVHDLMLSDPDARARVYDEVTAWLRTLR